MSHEDYAKLVPIIRDHHLIVISDEIYAELTYDGKFASLAQFDEIKDQVIVINGFSKAFAMTGWRLGYILANPTLIQAMNKIHQYIIMSAPTAAQYGAIEGLRKGLPHVQEMVDSYRCPPATSSFPDSTGSACSAIAARRVLCLPGHPEDRAEQRCVL